MRDISLVKNNIKKMIDQNAPERDIDAYIDSEGYTINDLKTPERSTLDSVVNAPLDFAKGLPTGLGRAATGFVQTATDLGEAGAEAIEKRIYGDVLGQETFGDKLRGQVGEQNKRQEKLPLAERAGIAVGEVAPFLATGVGTGRAITAGTSKVAPKVIASGLGLAGGGAVGGAVSEGLAAREDKGRVEASKEGALIGAVATPVLGAIGAGIKKVPNIFKRIFSKGTPEDVASEAIQPETAKRALKELEGAPKDKPTTGLDIQDPEFQEFTRSVIGRYPQSRQIAQDFAKGRNKEAFSRIDTDLKKLSKSGNADEYSKQLKDTRTAISSPLYDKAYSEGGDIGKRPVTLFHGTDRAFDEFDINKTSDGTVWFTNNKSDITNPSRGVSAAGKGRIIERSLPGNIKLADEDIADRLNVDEMIRDGYDGVKYSGSENSGEWYQIFNPEKLSKTSLSSSKNIDNLYQDDRVKAALKTATKDFGIKSPANSVEALHGARQSIDDTISVAQRQGENSKARSYTLLRNDINKVLYEESPALKEADEVFSKYSTLMRAIDDGKNFKKSTPFDIKKNITDLQKNSKIPKADILENYRIGAKSALLKDVESAIKFEGSNIPTNIQIKTILNTKYKQEQLQEIFPTKKAFNEFTENLNQEALYNNVTKNLRLDKASIEEGKSGFVKNAFAYILSVATTGSGKTGAIVNSTKAGEAVLLKNYKNLNKSNATKLAKIFTNKKDSTKLLENIIKNSEPKQKGILAEIINDTYPYLLSNSINQLERKNDN